jgi:hypothetical protein
LGTFLLAATFLTMRNAKTTSEKVAAPVAQSQPKQAPATAKPPAPAKPNILNAQDAVRAIISPGTPLKGARFSMLLDTRELGGRREHDFASLAGRFEGAAGQRSFDVKSASLDNGKREAGRVVSSAGSAFIFRSGDAYPVAPRTVKNAAKLRQVLAGSGDQSAAKLPAVDPAPWVKHLEATDGGKVDGTATTRVTGVLDSKTMAKDVKTLFKTATKGSAQPASLPKGFGRDFQQVFKGAKLDAYVGTQDKIVRKLRITVTGRQPQSVLDKGETARWSSVLRMRMAAVNQPQKIEAPKPAKAKLHGKAARSVSDTYLLTATVIDPPGGLAQTGVGLLRLNAVGRATRIPHQVNRAIKAHKRVVLFFYQRRGVDDRETAAAVLSLRKRTKTAVFSDSIDNLAAYGQVVQSVGVTRAPAVVIIGRHGRARLVDGYIDPAALAQEVADTR